MTEFDITVKFRINANEKPTAEEVDYWLDCALFDADYLPYPSSINVLSILHTDEEFLKVLGDDEEGDEVVLDFRWA